MNVRGIIILVLVGSCWPPGLLLAGEADGITVIASGEAIAKPDRLQIRVRTSAAAELGADAVVKHREAARRAKEAFEKLKIEKLQIEELGLGFSNNVSAEENVPQTPPNVRSETDIHKLFRLTVSGIEKLSEEELTKLVARLFDAARDSGAMLEGEQQNNNYVPVVPIMAMPNPVVNFVTEDVSKARSSATEQAFRAARDKALELAKLSGAKLGPVLAVEEIVPGEAYGVPLTGDSKLSSQAYTELPVRINLRVRFALHNEASKQ
jgi:uncharacterized protein